MEDIFLLILSFLLILGDCFSQNQHKARTAEVIQDHKDKFNINRSPISFSFHLQVERSVRKETVGEIRDYNETLNHIEKEKSNEYGYV